ncbi:MAG: hypothetical protein LBQ10_00645 [Desulfovibrio sp.]|nr:hypothetical protein [Desulfovibrio sp.]
MPADTYITLRALPKGYTEPDGYGGHVIHVTRCSVFVHNVFNFDPEFGEGVIGLRYLDGEMQTVTFSGSDKNFLNNGHDLTPFGIPPAFPEYAARSSPYVHFPLGLLPVVMELLPMTCAFTSKTTVSQSVKGKPPIQPCSLKCFSVKPCFQFRQRRFQ